MACECQRPSWRGKHCARARKNWRWQATGESHSGTAQCDRLVLAHRMHMSAHKVEKLTGACHSCTLRHFATICR
eukprot:1583668-Pleurochrysis_carterae.AAC.3